MLFNSIDFFILLAVTVLLYWQSASIFWRQNFLLIASLIFYAYWFPPYLLLFLGLTALAYFGGLQIAAGKKAALRLTVIGLLVILGIFKYTQFSLDLFNGMAGSLGRSTSLIDVNIRIPLGISFICFQLIGYLVDVARQKIQPERNFRIFTLFVGFFPQLIAGPICRAQQLIPQLMTKQPFKLDRFTGGILLLAVGLFLKVGFADGLAPFVDTVFSAEQYGQQPTAIAAGCFGIQIFCDFWGYSTMAVGAALLFGIEVPINFYLPYFATSLRDFWRRWHITLSDWFRDYVYFPLGGSRQKTSTTARNLMVTMGLCGLWHGASLTFVVWGLMHGAYLVAERWVRLKLSALEASRRPNEKFSQWSRALSQRLTGLLGWLLTLTFVMTSWIFFRAQTLTEAVSFTQAAWHLSPNYLAATLSEVPQSAWRILAAFVILQLPLQKIIDAAHTGRLHSSWRLVFAGWLFVLGVILSSGESFEFIYFEF